MPSQAMQVQATGMSAMHVVTAAEVSLCVCIHVCVVHVYVCVCVCVWVYFFRHSESSHAKRALLRTYRAT